MMEHVPLIVHFLLCIVLCGATISLAIELLRSTSADAYIIEPTYELREANAGHRCFSLRGRAIEAGSDVSKEAESHPPVNNRFNSYVRNGLAVSLAKILGRLSIAGQPFYFA